MPKDINSTKNKYTISLWQHQNLQKVVKIHQNNLQKVAKTLLKYLQKVA